MNRKLLFIFLLIISQYLINCEEIDECNTGFEDSKKEVCEDIIGSSNETYKCYYNMSIGECQTKYKQCDKYTITGIPSANDKKTCSEIPLSDNAKKCEIITESGTSTCSEVYRICTDYKAGQDTCSNLKVNIKGTVDASKRCALNSDLKCDIHYNNCEDIKNKQDCIKNIPSEITKYCYWDDNSVEEGEHCKVEDSGCSNYTMINTISSTHIVCKDLKHGANSKCILDGEICKEEVLADCESYDGDDENICKSYKPIDSSQDNLVLKLSMCDFDRNKGTKCFTTPRLCANFTTGAGYNCEELTTIANDKNKKICFLEGSSCKEVSIECQGFEFESEKNKNACENITPYKNIGNTISVNEHSKCKYEGTACNLVDKECTDLNNNKDICNSHVFTDERSSTKKCIYKGGQCKEVSKTCEDYVITDNDVNDKANCEEIEETSQIYKCVYTSATTTPEVSPAECKTVERECSEGNGNKETCSSLKPTNETFYCLYTDNNQCIEQYISCNTTDDRILCESNIPEVQYKECILQKDSQCTLSTKKCSEYKGDNEQECKYCEAIDTTNNECVYVNNQCIEQPKTFKFCSDYRGKDEKICESINPLKPDGTSYTSSVKCQIKNNKCILIEPECSAITNKEECFTTLLEDENKICVFYNNKCQEQYKDCTTFNTHQGSDETANKNTCESLIGETCIYNTGTGTGTCQAATQECKHFNPDLYEIQKECTDTTLADKTKKCVYKNGKCSKKTKTCLELSEFESQTPSLSKEQKESACKNAEPSEENKECTLKDDETGCKEVNKSENSKDEDIKSPDTSKTDSNGDSNQDSGNEGNTSNFQCLNKLLIFIICLLF